MSIFFNREKILYLKQDTRTSMEYYQVVGKTKKRLKLGDFIDVKVDLEDNPQEWVLCRVCKIQHNVYVIEIVKEI